MALGPTNFLLLFCLGFIHFSNASEKNISNVTISKALNESHEYRPIIKHKEIVNIDQINYTRKSPKNATQLKKNSVSFVEYNDSHEDPMLNDEKGKKITPNILHFIIALEEGHLRNTERSFWDLEDILRDPYYYLKDNIYSQDVLARLGPAPEYNYTLKPIFMDIPNHGRFSASLLESLCAQIQGVRIVGMILGGAMTDAARAFASVAHGLGVPVLWLRGAVTAFKGITENSNFEVMLEPSARETLEALRALFIQTHWHSFTVLADGDAKVVLSGDLGKGILDAPPLRATVRLLHSTPEGIFRQLVDVSLTTRGVILLLCDVRAAKRVIAEAKRLQLTNGHFVWLWVDTHNTMADWSLGTDFYDVDETFPRQSNGSYQFRGPLNQHIYDYILHGQKTSAKRDTSSSVNSDIINNELRNDSFSDTRKSAPEHLLPIIFNDKKYNESEMPSVHSVKSDYEFNNTKEKKWSGESGRMPPLLNGSAVSWDLPIDWSDLNVGLLSVRPTRMTVDRFLIRSGLKVFVNSLRSAVREFRNRFKWEKTRQRYAGDLGTRGCWERPSLEAQKFARVFSRELKSTTISVLSGKSHHNFLYPDKMLISPFEILNLVPNNNGNGNGNSESSKWRSVGSIRGSTVNLNTIVWPGGDILISDLHRFRNKLNKFKIVTAISPPFVMQSPVSEDNVCLRGLKCFHINATGRYNLSLVLQDIEQSEQEQTISSRTGRFSREANPLASQYTTMCCYGFAMDLLEHISRDLNFGFYLYIVNDGYFGTKNIKPDVFRHRAKSQSGIFYENGAKHLVLNGKYFKSDRFDNGEVFIQQPKLPEEEVMWNGIMGELMSGNAHLTFAPLSVTAGRSEVIDFTVPYYYSSASFLTSTKGTTEIPLLAFLLPFSFELWVAIFVSLNITAISVAVYEWLSPFGLNPWGRQRSKNFSISSALWVMWGLLCGHLVAFKAPKCWPNKFLINVWGGFSVIFVASYTANIAALIAGLFFQNSNHYSNDNNLLSKRVGIPKASAIETHIQENSLELWDHVRRYTLNTLEDGVAKLRNGSLDVLMADTPILDYYRGTDNGCKLKKIGETLMNHDAYAIGMVKGLPLKSSISTVITKYSNNGFLDILHYKWFGDLPCFKLDNDIIAQPRPLGVEAVSGVFLLLGCGIFLGFLILLFEHLFYKYTLPILRHKPRNSIWKSRNIMFFSQKLYRFINCVELVSPHHAARELVNTLRQGQITSLFQKSVIRKEHEQRRRRKSKAQFFEMIQEIRRVQQAERKQPPAASSHSRHPQTTAPPSTSSKRASRSPSLPSMPSLPSISSLQTLQETEIVESPKHTTQIHKSQFGSIKYDQMPFNDSLRFTKKAYAETLRNNSSILDPRILDKPLVVKMQKPPLPPEMNKSTTLDKPKTKLFNKKDLFRIKSETRNSNSNLNVRRFSSDSIFNDSHLDNIGRRLSRDIDIDTSPPDFNSKLSLCKFPMANKMETIPKYKGKTIAPSQGSCRQALTQKRPILRLDLYENKLELKGVECLTEVDWKPQCSSVTSVANPIPVECDIQSDNEMAKMKQMTIEQLQKNKSSRKRNVVHSQSERSGGNPLTDVMSQKLPLSSDVTITSSKDRDHIAGSVPTSRPCCPNRQDTGHSTRKYRHHQNGDKRTRSLEANLENNTPRNDIRPNKPTKKNKRYNQNKYHGNSYDHQVRTFNEFSARTTVNSPLTKLSRDDLVRLLESSDFELRRHLLNALKDKEDIKPP